MQDRRQLHIRHGTFRVNRAMSLCTLQTARHGTAEIGVTPFELATTDTSARCMTQIGKKAGGAEPVLGSLCSAIIAAALSLLPLQ